MADQQSTRIVGIGASAGGLIALEEFLAHTPADCGLAFVVVQHLAPTGKTLLSELLQKVTGLSVHEARQGELIKPNCVYVIPPNTEITVVDNRLRLAEPAEPRGMRLPVNVLFSSLASARGEEAIAVILSGMGSDGTLGIQAIKAVGGLGVVQSPESAQFDSMPRSAIGAGCADIQDSAEALPGRILAYVKKVGQPGTSAPEATPWQSENEALRTITNLLQKRTRHDFSLYRTSTLSRRIERRQAIHDLHSLEEYAEFLGHNAQEVDLLFNEILIGVTSFFRDPEAWEHLVKEALPELLAKKNAEQELRVWCVGCSTGEEAYSLAIGISEAIQRQDRPFKLQIFASDLNPEAIASARRGEYPLSIESSVSERRLARYFNKRDNHYQIKKPIRDLVLFAQHDVILDPPFTKLDLISCRNLLIYFDPRLQKRLLPLFSYSLGPGGLLLLGNSEGIGQLNHLFTPVHAKLRLFRRQDHAFGRGPEFLLKSYPPLSGIAGEPDVNAPTPSDPSADSLQAAADRLLLQVYSPAAVVLNRDADIVYISGRTGKYLEPAAGKANWNIHAMARDGLRQPLAGAIKRVAASEAPIKLHGLEVHSESSTLRVDITIQAVSEPASLRGLTMVVFSDVTDLNPGPQPGKQDGSRGKMVDPQPYQDEIHALREEARSYREEAQAAQEELQSTNEELQSANEELTTSKEEMQSMNEELQTINSELQCKLDDLLLAQSDMQNILNSVEIAILFLDKDLNVRRFTERAAGIISLRGSDVGRPLSDLTNNLAYPELQQNAQETLRTLKPTERQIQSTDKRWFDLRIIPYRRLDDVIDGVVITLVDITEAKKLEQSLRDREG